MSKKGVKYLICGNPKSGKTFATKGLKDAYVLNADVEKKYPLDLIHSNIYPYKFFGKKSKGKNIEWSNVNNFYDEIRGKLTAYKKIKGSYPKAVVFDTITALYSMLVSKNTKTIKNVYGSLGVANTEDIATLNSNVIEKLLIGNGIDVIILAHTNYNAESGLWEIPAEGERYAPSYCEVA